MRPSRASIFWFAFLFLLTGLSRGANVPGKPLGEFLGPDGRLRVPAGFNGSLDPAGYGMALDATGAPRFVSTKSPGTAKPKNLGGGASLEDGWDIRFSRSGASFDPNSYPEIQIKAVASDGTNVYVGGIFFAVGQTLATNIAMWDGSHWHALGLGLTPSYSGEVSAIAILGTNVYAAGYFTVAGDQYANSIARWDGTAWSALGKGTQNGVRSANGANAGGVAALQVAGNQLYVAGSFGMAGGVPAVNVASWDGSQWHALGAGVTGTLTSLAAQGGIVYAAGLINGNVQAWDGSQWSPLNLSFSSQAYVSWMGFMGTNLICSTTAAETSEDVLAIWDGQTWNSLPITTSDGGSIASSGNPGYAYFYRPGPLAGLGTNLFLAATIQTTNNDMVTGWLEWNGTNWTMVDGGLTTGFLGYPYVPALYGAYSDGKHIYLAGDFDSLHNNQSAAGVVGFDGSHLQPFDEGSGQGIPMANVDVYMSRPQALAVDGGNLYAAVDSGAAGGVGCNGIGRWDGHAWHPLGEGLENGVTTTVAGEPYIYPGTVNAICVAGTNIYVGGAFTAAGTTYANNIAYWDGAAWHALGNGVNNGVNWGSSPYSGQGVYAIAVYGTNVFAGGFFSLAGGQPALSIARWDGSQWHAVSPQFDYDEYGNAGQVRQFAVGPDGLYMIGAFITGGNGSVAFNYVARWDGASLQPVGGGVSQTLGFAYASSVTSSGTNIYIGGIFNGVGGVSVTDGVAAWDGQVWKALPGQYVIAGTNPPVSPEITAIACDGGDIYAAGAFYLNGSNTEVVQGVAKLTGTNWTILSPYFDGWSAAVAVLGRSLYVEGYFDAVGTKLSYGLARYSFVPYVSVTSSTSPAMPSADATIQFIRTGPTDLPLTVDYSVAGTAVSGVDFAALPGAITIPAGSSSASLAVQALSGPGAATNATVVVNVEDGGAFTAGVPQAATVVLAPSLMLTAVWQSGPSLLLQSQVAPGAVYLLQTATNLAPPVNWLTVATNTADQAGRWSHSDTNVAGAGARFYRLRTP